jgi:kynurenine 3-monooxygenase
MALANFVEMRDKVASPVFRLGKRVEHGLERLFPGRYISRYELVSFTTTPYAQIQQRVQRQHQYLAAAALLGAGVLGAAARIARRQR